MKHPLGQQMAWFPVKYGNWKHTQVGGNLWGRQVHEPLGGISEVHEPKQTELYSSCLPRPLSSALLPFFGEGSPTKIDYRKKGSLILTSLLEDLAT